MKVYQALLGALGVLVALGGLVALNGVFNGYRADSACRDQYGKKAYASHLPAIGAVCNVPPNVISYPYPR